MVSNLVINCWYFGVILCTTQLFLSLMTIITFFELSLLKSLLHFQDSACISSFKNWRKQIEMSIYLDFGLYQGYSNQSILGAGLIKLFSYYSKFNFWFFTTTTRSWIRIRQWDNDKVNKSIKVYFTNWD